MKALLVTLAIISLATNSFSKDSPNKWRWQDIPEKTLEEVEEVEEHFHSYERWFGAAAVASGETHVADRINKDITTFQVDAANDDFSDWLQILGSGDTPAVAGKQKYDLHRIFIIDVQRNSATHLIQICLGDSANALTQNRFTEFIYHPAAVTAEETPIDIQMPNLSVGTKAWLRLCVPDQDTGTMDFYIGIHEYDE